MLKVTWFNLLSVAVVDWHATSAMLPIFDVFSSHHTEKQRSDLVLHAGANVCVTFIAIVKFSGWR